jgi:hypothetical protein
MRGFGAAVLAGGLAMLAGGAGAQSFTTSEEVRPILEATRASWVALGAGGGSDLLYFTHLAAWRCGIAGASYRLNGAAADVPFDLEPCYRDTAQPNAIKGLPFVTLPADSVASVVVTVQYPDGSSDTAKYERRDILLP